MPSPTQLDRPAVIDTSGIDRMFLTFDVTEFRNGQQSLDALEAVFRRLVLGHAVARSDADRLGVRVMKIFDADDPDLHDPAVRERYGMQLVPQKKVFSIKDGRPLPDDG